MKLFNTLTRKKEDFKPLKNNKVGIYTCGPTVYSYAHIGNLRTYVFEDILKRVLMHNKYEVKHVMNITDVGHLTSDADTGEDKVLLAARKEGKSAWDIAGFYTKAFKEDIKKLNIIEPNIWCKATDHIKEQLELIKRLEEKGFTYKEGGNVYFDTSKLKDYGRLAKLNLKKLKAGARIEIDKNKKNPFDFVLWFTKSKFKDQEMLWDSEYGNGYPGWHLECSAMSSKYLGEKFDIHCGGVDHVNVHHTNEIAQSEAAFGKKPWVKYWVHGEFLIIDKGRMGKSEGNFITLQSLIDKGYDPVVYRYFLLGTHYRSQLMFSFEALDAAKNAFERLKEKMIEIKENQNSKGDGSKYEKEFFNAVNDDLDTPKALAVMWEMLKDSSLGNKEKHVLLLKFDKIFGLNLGFIEAIKVPAEIKKLVDEREKARKKKDFKKADEIREKVKKKGYVLEDTEKGVRVKSE
ncbi:MAG: cysteine--tRNA ligase [Candidatus Woesearchaeota archaeon]|nr:MAG: cysteine--tRNA ligase [Candidatus Woesearchaeota archaeon]